MLQPERNAHLLLQRRIAQRDAAFRLYAILDAESCERRGFSLHAVAVAWRDAGVRLLQYRDKRASDDAVLANAAMVREVFAGTDAVLILNDRVHLFHASRFDGVHVGQGDVPVAKVREIIGENAALGISTHNPAQLKDADALDVSYVAIGPVFATSTKLDADPVVGLGGVRMARALTQKTLVAIGGINADRASDVFTAGADSVAVIGGLLGDKPAISAADLLRVIGSLS